MEHRLPAAEGQYLLKKFPGKGGWTYAEVPEIQPAAHTPFGWVAVTGSVDNYDLEHTKLMPMGNGQLFLPVKAAIRKKIKKEAGDYVQLKLFRIETPETVTEELLECFQNEAPQLYETFLKFTDAEQKAYLNWIYTAKSEDLKVERITRMMERLESGLRFFE